MSTVTDYVGREVKRWREERFKHHQITASRGGHESLLLDSDCMIEWRNPRTWTYGVRYIIHAQWLCVVGDLFEATYQWSEHVNVQFLGNINMDYFAGKMRAGPEGRKWNDWNNRVAAYELRFLWSDNALKKVPSPFTEEQLSGKVESDEWADRESCNLAASEIADSTGDCELAGVVSCAGDVPAVMLIGHWVGMRMIRAHLTNPMAQTAK